MPVNPPLTLVIGNKNYSSWSMRPWVALTGAGIVFQEHLVKLDSEDWDASIERLSPSQRVPVLWEGEPGAGFPTWDTLAIIERAHELFPANGIWPAEPRARARARSICAEMHAGFAALRNCMPMNIRSRHPGKGMGPGVQQDIDRIARIWSDARAEFGRGGAYLFGDFSAADAYFSPVATRFITYGVSLSGAARDYQQTLLAAPAVAKWIAGALSETDFLSKDEPYAAPPAGR